MRAGGVGYAGCDVPQSYCIRFMPRNTAGRRDIAAEIALRHLNFSKADILTTFPANLHRSCPTYQGTVI